MHTGLGIETTHGLARFFAYGNRSDARSIRSYQNFPLSPIQVSSVLLSGTHRRTKTRRFCGALGRKIRKINRPLQPRQRGFRRLRFPKGRSGARQQRPSSLLWRAYLLGCLCVRSRSRIGDDMRPPTGADEFVCQMQQFLGIIFDRGARLRAQTKPLLQVHALRAHIVCQFVGETHHGEHGDVICFENRDFSGMILARGALLRARTKPPAQIPAPKSAISHQFFPLRPLRPLR